MLDLMEVRSDDYEMEGGEHICLLCGKTITNLQTAKTVELDGGCSVLVTDEEVATMGSGGAFLVGSGCYRRHRAKLRPYLR